MNRSTYGDSLSLSFPIEVVRKGEKGTIIDGYEVNHSNDGDESRSNGYGLQM